jgi:ABC-2 type transport system permease protein
MSTRALARPYVALFTSRWQLMLQYRGAALAGFATQCWWGGIKVMVLAAFYGTSVAAAPVSLTLSQAVTYTWIAQGLLALLPWAADPDITTAVRTGAVSYDRLRPLDFYGLWFARAAGWVAARVAPRALLMATFATLILPWLGLTAWSWQPPASEAAALLFALSLLLALLLSATMIMLINIGAAALLDARGLNAIVVAPVTAFSGSLLPLSLFPDTTQLAMLAQPFAGLLDIPMRIYLQQLSGMSAWAGLGLQAFWIIALVLIGRYWLTRVLHTLEMQGG